jgi:hypothetical protein
MMKSRRPADISRGSSAGIGEAEPPLGVSLMLTRRCNMSCSHCSVESGPRVRGEPTEAELTATLNSIADAGLKAVQLTGGEPMIREKLVLDLLRLAKSRGLSCTMSSNGFWGRKPAAAWRKVRALRRAGLDRITISYDRYHTEFQGPEPALNIARACEWYSLPLNINVTRVRDDPELAAIVKPFEKRKHLRMRFYDVQAIGRARELPLAQMRSEISGFCNACCTPAITDDGRVAACNGPAYFLDSQSPLVIGSMRERTLPELLDRHTDDPILETIRRAGPERLLRELEDAGVAREIGIRRTHAGMCDLCIDINSNTAAVAILRERLGSQQHKAELTARRLVLRKGFEEGTIGIQHANGPGVAKLWLDGASGRFEQFDSGAERILGRADFDWSKGAEYLVACGMSRAVAGLLDRPSLRRWAPSFFVDRIRQSAITASFHDLSQREVLRRISSTLASISAKGVLLKGAALMAIDEFGGGGKGSIPRRAAGDVDIYVEASSASALRNALLASGFTGDRGASRTGPHHLAPVLLNGVVVEIHTRIMPGFWGLPEEEMLWHAIPVSGLPSLSTLDAEGMLVHSLTHSTAHIFSHGMRAAWDAAWIMERNPALDLMRLKGWVDSLTMPRAFWVPARALSKAMVALPQDLMGHAPGDERERRLERVADFRIYSAVEGAFDLNPISKNGFFLMLHDSALGRVKHLASLFGAEERESRRTAAARTRQLDLADGHSVLAVQLREGMTHWKQFQRAIMS